MYKYNIYIGKFDKDTKKQELTNKQFEYTIDYILRLFYIECYTSYNCNGVYRHQDNRTRVFETSINIEIIRDNAIPVEEIIKLKKKLCTNLNQESVLITKQEIQVL